MPIHSTKAQLPPAPQNFARKKTVILEQLAVPDDSYTDLSPKGSVDVGIRDLIDEINAIDGLVTTSSCAGRVSVFLEGHKSAYYSSSAVTSPLSVSDATDHQLIGSIDGTWEAAVAVSSLGAAAGGTVAGTGGKGGGGKWLFVSHDQVETQGKLDSEPNIVAALFGLEEPIFDGHLGAAVEDLGDGESRLIHFKFEPMVCALVCFERMAKRGESDADTINRSSTSSLRPLSTPRLSSAALCKLASVRAEL